MYTQSEPFMPVSDYQRDIWAAESRSGGGPQFNVAIHERLEGAIDLPALRACVHRALQRHGALRMRFSPDASGGLLVGADTAGSTPPGEVRTVDLSAEPDPAAAARAWCDLELYAPLSVTEGPLASAAVLSEGPGAAHLFIKVHHIVCDAWALNSLSSEILDEYRAQAAGEPFTPAERAPFTPAGAAEKNDDDLKFHRENLRDAVPALFTRSTAGPPERGRSSFTVDGKTVRRILEAGASPFAYLASAFAVVLGRLHRAPEVILGVPFLNRTGEAERGVIGQFANNLPLRIPVDPGAPLLELARDTRERVRTMRAHQALPLGEILRAAPGRTAGGLFDVTLSYMRFPRPREIPGVARATRIMAPVHDDKAISVMVHAFEDEDDLRIDLDYARDVFDGHLTAEAVAGHVTELLRKGLDMAELPLSALSMLTDEEYEEVVRRHQGEPARYPGEKTLHGLFAEQAARTPGHPAVADAAGRWSMDYSELDRRSNQVARALRGEGVGPGTRVAVLAERGPELLPALLGILKAGGAYVPVDPASPPARIAMLLQDCGAAAALLGPGAPADAIPDGVPAHAVTDLFRGPESPLPPLAGSADPAYVIYTSGSTGRPKGVVVQHHSVVNRLAWMQRHYPIGPGDTLLQKTPVSFDVSVWELFWWGAEGARAVLLPPGAEKDPREIARAVRQNGVTALHFVPSMLGPFLDLLEGDRQERDAAAGMRQVFCSGEALPPERVNTFNRIFAAEQEGGTAPLLVNLYGPTEAAVDVTRYDCPPASGGPVRRVPIGRPVQNTSVYILGPHGGPQPVGAPGELCIGGVQVALGYLNRPELTAERFIDDPFAPGGRLYRTGDLARLLADGSIEYLGRIDSQVKIRGNRVELGEVQNALVAVDRVREAAVIDRAGEAGGTVLVGYYTSAEEIPAAELRGTLGAELPEYMVPSRFVRMDALPLTPNGKLDRSRLPDPPAAGSTGREPRTPTETALLEAVRDVLGTDQIGVHDDYFAMGGDSISLLRVRARAERAGVGFTLSDFVRSPTVAALAETVDAESGSRTVRRGAGAEPFALVSQVDRARLEGKADAFPLGRLQLGLLFHSRERKDSAVYKDVFRYSLALPWEEGPFREAFARLAARHPALRSSFDLGGFSEPLQIVDRSAPEGALGVNDLRSAPADAAEERITAHMRERCVHAYRFDRAPLYRFEVFVLPETVEIVFSFHHALLDGGSVANLMSELLQDYCHTSGMPIGPVEDGPLPSPALYTADERAAIAEQESRDYWRTKLDGAAPPEIEGFRSHEPGDGAAGGGTIVRHVPLPDGIERGLRALSEDRGVPAKSVLFAAHALTLRTFSGQNDLTTGLVTHGRPDVEDGERICGLFLNTVPVRFSFAGGTWLEAARNLMRQEREDHPHRRVPLAVIQEDLGGRTLVDTAFNYIRFRQLAPVFRLPDVQDRGFTAWEETNFALLVNAMGDPVDGRTTLRMDFSGEMYTPGQADLFAGTFLALLDRITAAPDAPADPSFLAPGTPTRPVAGHTDVVTVFAERARSAPEAAAVVADGTEWSYAELDRRTAGIARMLLAVGARQGDRIGIAMDRSPATVAVTVGAARAGCSVVPLDTSYPQERLRAMVEAADPVRIVASREHEHLVEDASRLLPAESLLDGSAAPGAAERTGPLPAVAPGDEAYLLFTSGSTGAPKGVSMPHRSLANLIAWQNGTATGAAGRRTLQYAPLSFDVSFQELYSTLCGGGTLVVVDEELRRDMPALLRLMVRTGVERIYMPYIALQRLAEAADALGIVPRALKAVVSSGEQLRVTEEIRRLCASLDGAVLENQYGPTESHVVTSYAMSGDPARFPALPPIGRAVAGTRAVVLLPDGREAPVGGKGEIHLGGACLASGYAGRPDLTAERFIDDGRGGRLYRTGDIGMVLPGGEVVCLGRSDRQVKIRGYRVEPAEAELALVEAAAAAGVRAAEVAVVPRHRGNGDSFLAAYLVGDGDAADLDTLRRRLRSALPEHLLPTHYAWLPSMPTTPSGKRDDGALARLPVHGPKAGGGEATAPRDERERALAEMAGELLNTAAIGVHDDLFELGATSITAMRLVVLVEQRFGTVIPLSELIASPTVADLAARVSEAEGTGHGGGAAERFDPLVPIRTGGDRAPLFYVHPMGGNVLCYVPFAKRLPPDRPMYALQAFGTDAGTEPVRGMEAIAAGYIEAVRRVQPHGPYHIGGWSFGGFVAFEMARQLRAAGEEIASLVVLDTTALNPERRERTDDEALIAWFFWELLWLQRGGESPEAVIPAELTTLDEKFEYITALAVAEGVLPPGSTDAIVRRLFRLYEANWRSAFDYWPEEVDQDMVLVHAVEPLPEVLLSMHTAIRSMHEDPANGWRQRTSGRLTVVEAEGDHLTIMEEPYVAAVAAAAVGAAEAAEADQADEAFGGGAGAEREVR